MAALARACCMARWAGMPWLTRDLKYAITVACIWADSPEAGAREVVGAPATDVADGVPEKEVPA